MRFHKGMEFFATSRNYRIWACDTKKGTLEIIYSGDMAKPDMYTINQQDNITVTAFGDVLLTLLGQQLNAGRQGRHQAGVGAQVRQQRWCDLYQVSHVA